MAKRTNAIGGELTPDALNQLGDAHEEKPAPKKGGDNGKGKKGPSRFQRIGHWFKEMWSELKKVTWSPLPKVFKQTGVVLVVTLSFLLVLLAIDSGLAELLKLLLP